MKTLPQALVQEKNAISSNNPWLVLVDLQLPGAPNYYFVSNNENVSFRGRTYTAFPFMLDAMTESSSGEVPTVGLRVANVTQIIHAWLEDLDGAVGSTVVIRVVNTGHLDEDYAELELEFIILSTTADAEWITFTLGASNPLRRRFPKYRYISSHCNWAGNFKGVECRYSGATTSCDGTWESCEALNNTRNFGGYRGLSEKGWKVV